MHQDAYVDLFFLIHQVGQMGKSWQIRRPCQCCSPWWIGRHPPQWSHSCHRSADPHGLKGHIKNGWKWRVTYGKNMEKLSQTLGNPKFLPIENGGCLLRQGTNQGSAHGEGFIIVGLHLRFNFEHDCQTKWQWIWNINKEMYGCFQK